MGLFRNADVASRVWPSLRATDGTTLSLAPGETAEVEVPDDFEDHWLRPAPVPTPQAAKAPEQPAAKPADPAVSAADPKE